MLPFSVLKKATLASESAEVDALLPRADGVRYNRKHLLNETDAIEEYLAL